MPEIKVTRIDGNAVGGANPIPVTGMFNVEGTYDLERFEVVTEGGLTDYPYVRCTFYRYNSSDQLVHPPDPPYEAQATSSTGWTVPCGRLRPTPAGGKTLLKAELLLGTFPDPADGPHRVTAS
jgi:hypothetical protein